MKRDGAGPAEALVRAGVTEREAEVLSAVAERLRNREIAERLHLSVRTVESHIAALLRKLGVADRAALAEFGMNLRRSARTIAPLPAPLSSLVGRENETSDIVAMIDTHRLVTLVGPGGVGKTRLALRVATLLGDRYPESARLADLAPVGPELVGDTVARALGVAPQPGWSLRDILREAAGGLRGVLVVDNCEHVVAEAADIVADLLTAGTDLRVLATSREPLGIPGEVSYQVPPLLVPTSRDAAHAATAATFDAVRLFIDRATTAAPGFTFTDAISPAVAALCQRLDGLPLAIELAASRIRTFAAVELVEHLDQRFELLSAGARTVPARQRTLRGTIGWSYGLLDDDERALFDQLGVFPADFDYDAAQAICGADRAGEVAVMTLLPRLVDKSLVSAIERGPRRYRLLESIRAYAAEQLAASGNELEVRRRHASHYLALAEHGGEQLRAWNQRAWVDRLTAEQPNLRAALAHSIAAGDVESAWRWIAALQRFWDITGKRLEAQDWIQRTLAIGDPPATAPTVAGLVAASAIMQSSHSQAAFDLATRAELAAVGLDDFSRANASRAVGISAFWVKPDVVLPKLHEALAGFDDDQPWQRAITMQHLTQTTSDLSEAMRWGQASVTLFRSVGDQMYAANTLFIMAQRAIYAGIASDEVRQMLVESKELADATGSDEDQAHATVGFGQLAWLCGDHEDAARLMEACLPTLRRLGDQRCTGRALWVLGERAYQQQDFTAAEQLLTQSIAAIVPAGQSVVLVSALEALAAVYGAQGRARPAAVLLGAADTARSVATAHMRPAGPPDETLRRRLAQALGSDAFYTAYDEGQRLSPMQALGVASSTVPRP
jgi:predicted ATPase/DNA-binding CsgD family transcriptional regulator